MPSGLNPGYSQAQPNSVLTGKNPEDVVRRYMQKVKNPPDEVSPWARRRGGGQAASPPEMETPAPPSL